MKSIISLVLVITLFTTAVSVYAQTEFKDYKGKFVEFQYPVEWESGMNEGLNRDGVYVDKDDRISFDIPNTEGTFTVLIKDAENKNLDELLNEEISSYEEHESIWGYKKDVLEVADTNLSNELAKKIIVYTEKYDNKFLQVVSVYDNKRYSVVYLIDTDLFDDYLPTIEKMIQSIKFTENINALKSYSENSDQSLFTKKDNIVNIASGDSNIQESNIPANVMNNHCYC